MILSFLLSAAVAASPVQGLEEALAHDATDYARRHSVDHAEAVRRLRAQQDSVAVTDRLRRELGPRLGGISIEHAPQYRIRLLLTGTEPVSNQAALAAGSPVPVVFQLGAQASRAQLVAAMRQHRPTLERMLPNARGMGVDQSSGEVVLLVTQADATRLGMTTIEEQAEAISGVPVRIAIANPPATDMVLGGGRVEGSDPTTGRRFACTTGFVVERAAQTGVVTAAHCPDSLVYLAEDGRRVPLEFAGGWGARHQDVQVHVAPEAQQPLFYADRRQRILRTLTGARPREGIRAGDTVCHWGESSGYSCSEIQLTDYAPPGDLCGGPCEPMWTTAGGPGCRAGDSGGPIFIGNTAFGIAKGGSGTRSRCNFYYFMSTDYVPDDWRLRFADDEQARP